MSSAPPQPLLPEPAQEQAAVNLLRHLEWDGERFSLVFLFADVGPAVQMAEWLNQRLASQGKPLCHRNVPEGFTQAPEATVDALMSELSALSAQPGAVWFAAHRHPQDAVWNRARSAFVARLNERRFLLERDLKRPLVLVLPVAFRAQVSSMAPDIWHVRALSAELVAHAVAPAAFALQPIPSLSSASASPRSSAQGEKSEVPAPLHAVQEWRRMQAQSQPEQWYLPTALDAVRELLDAGRPAEAHEVAAQAVQVARQSVERLGGTPETWRDLSISLDNVGRVAQARGDWAAAGEAYRESLGLSRQLVERLGGTPETWRDLSVSLNNVGRVARVRGDWMAAEEAYRESLGLGRQLVERLGGTPETWRDLSVLLDNVGRVARARGDWAAAEEAYRESLGLRRQLVERLGGTPETWRDLSISLDNVGRVARARGDWAAAEEAYRESLGLRRQLVERLGGTPQTWRDLSVSLNNVGRVAQARGDWAAADEVYRESLGLRRQLVERLGGTPETWDDAAVALVNLSQGSDKPTAELEEALAIYRRLAASHPEVANYRERAKVVASMLENKRPAAAQKDT